MRVISARGPCSSSDLHSCLQCSHVPKPDASTAAQLCYTYTETVLMQAIQDPSHEENRNKHSNLRNTFLLAIPTMFDLTATILMSIGLLFVTASVYQVSGSCLEC